MPASSLRPRVCGALLFAALTGVGGFFIGWSLRPAPTAPMSAANPVVSAPAFAARVEPSAAATSASASAQDWDETAWRRLHGSAGSPHRTAALGALLEQLAAHAPARALELAQAEGNRILRRELLQHVLRGWSGHEPFAAGQWALAAEPDFREEALTAVFAGAVAVDPSQAVAAGHKLLQLPGADVAGCGNHLVVALCEAGAFSAATEFARTADSTPERNGMLGDAFARWAAFQPDQAASAASALSDTERLAALRGVIGGWSRADPAAAVNYATNLPLAANEKAELEGQALLRWSKTDLKAASDWINSHELGAAMDRGVAAIATQDYMKPDVALSWAESVVDPALKSETLTSVLRRWATVDPGAARHYLESSSALQPDDRKEIEGLLATLSGTSS